MTTHGSLTLVTGWSVSAIPDQTLIPLTVGQLTGSRLNLRPVHLLSVVAVPDGAQTLVTF